MHSKRVSIPGHTRVPTWSPHHNQECRGYLSCCHLAHLILMKKPSAWHRSGCPASEGLMMSGTEQTINSVKGKCDFCVFWWQLILVGPKNFDKWRLVPTTTAVIYPVPTRQNLRNIGKLHENLSFENPFVKVTIWNIKLLSNIFLMTTSTSTMRSVHILVLDHIFHFQQKLYKYCCDIWNGRITFCEQVSVWWLLTLWWTTLRTLIIPHRRKHPFNGEGKNHVLYDPRHI